MAIIFWDAWSLDLKFGMTKLETSEPFCLADSAIFLSKGNRVTRNLQETSWRHIEVSILKLDQHTSAFQLSTLGSGGTNSYVGHQRRVLSLKTRSLPVPFWGFTLEIDGWNPKLGGLGRC